ncbi:MAG: hypothetical protein ABFS05_02715 [Bacteroidota bacterium]
MRRHSKIVLFVLIAVVLWFGSCKKVEKFSEIPRIEFINFEKIYNPDLEIYDRGVLSFSFEDGDGDIGLNSSDTFPPYDASSDYHYNLIISFFELQNGELAKVPILWYNPDTEEFDTLSLSARIPDLTPQGTNKAINGEIHDTLFMYNFNSDFDTIKFEAYILDRALHESNTISTPLIVRK